VLEPLVCSDLKDARVFTPPPNLRKWGWVRLLLPSWVGDTVSLVFRCGDNSLEGIEDLDYLFCSVLNVNNADVADIASADKHTRLGFPKEDIHFRYGTFRETVTVPHREPKSGNVSKPPEMERFIGASCHFLL
jgi:hypothetical protein